LWGIVISVDNMAMSKMIHSPAAERAREFSVIRALWPDNYLLLPAEAREQLFSQRTLAPWKLDSCMILSQAFN
jgi:hypothetical protein